MLKMMMNESYSFIHSSILLIITSAYSRSATNAAMANTSKNPFRKLSVTLIIIMPHFIGGAYCSHLLSNGIV